jgi:hypothetical protein
MPIKSEAQRRFMYASLAGKTDVSPSVARRFVGPKAHKADGGAVEESDMKKPLPPFMMKKGEKAMPPKAGKAKKMMSGGKAMGYAKGGGCEVKGKTKGKMV